MDLREQQDYLGRMLQIECARRAQDSSIMDSMKSGKDKGKRKKKVKGTSILTAIKFNSEQRWFMEHNLVPVNVKNR